MHAIHLRAYRLPYRTLLLIGMFLIGLYFGAQAGIYDLMNKNPHVRSPSVSYENPPAATNHSKDDVIAEINRPETPRIIAEVYDVAETTRLLNQMADHLARYRVQRPWEVAEHILLAAETHDVDPLLILSVGTIESAWRMDVVSHKGAVGPMQVMPDTFYNDMGGEDIRDWKENILVGAGYLAKMIEWAGGDLVLALGYYNAGPSRSDALIRRITAQYAIDIIQLHDRFAGPGDGATFYARR